MTWFKVDDSFCDHPKVEELLCDRHAADAIALWTLAGSWCAKHLTDGVISVAKVSRLGIKKHEEAARELVRVGLWIEADGGFKFRDWAQYQPTKEAVTADRQRANERQRRHRDASRVTPSDKPVTANVTHDVTRDKRCDDGVSHKGPTRPDPTRPIEETTQGTPASPSPPAPLSALESRVVETPDASGEFERSPDSGAVATEQQALPLSDGETPQASESKPSAGARELFEHWRSVMGKSSTTKLDAARKRRCEWAIREYGLEAARIAIDGCTRSDWHMGRDPRSNGEKYNDLTLIFRDAAHFEKFRDLATGSPPSRIRHGFAPPADASQFTATEITPELFAKEAP